MTQDYDVGLARFAWAIGGQLAQYAMSNISPSPEVTIHRGYAGTKCFEYIRDDWGRLVWVGRLPEHDREPDDGT